MEIKFILKHKYFQAIIAILIPLLLGWMMSMIAMSRKEPFYFDLEKPPYTPPDFVFPIAWTLIYICMGWASFRVYDKRIEAAKFPLILYIVQLFFNITWSPVFFFFHLVGFALIHIMLVFVLLVFTGLLFYRIDKLAGLLFIPYGLWVTFASCVMVAIFKMN